MFLAFEKWHGCLNDFAVVWISDSDGDIVENSLRRQGRALCDRHAGIGADGVLVLRTKKRGDLTPYSLTIINSDGTVAKNCGNGLRCAALSVLTAHREKGDPKNLPEMVELAVEGVPMVCRFLKSTGAYPLVAVEMGVPVLGEAVSWALAAKREVMRVAAELKLPGLTDDMAVAEIGNPHIMLTTEHASRDLVLKVGPALQKSSAWDGMNVHLVKSVAWTAGDRSRAGQELGHPVSDAFQAFVWERGAGETMACGSGACAIAAAAFASGLIDRSNWVAVDMPGGRLYVRHASASDPVLLAGPGAFVYSGKLSI